MVRVLLLLAVVLVTGCVGALEPPPTAAPAFAVLRLACDFATVWTVRDSLWLLPAAYDFRAATGATLLIRWSPTISTGTTAQLAAGDTLQLACAGDAPISSDP